MLRQAAFFDGREVPGGDGCKDLAWFHPSGRELAEGDWFDGGLRTIGMYLDGRGLRRRDRRGELIIDESFLLVLHAGDQGVRFTLPGRPWADSYVPVIDTGRPSGTPTARAIAGDATLRIGARTSLVLRAQRDV